MCLERTLQARTVVPLAFIPIKITSAGIVRGKRAPVSLENRNAINIATRGCLRLDVAQYVREIIACTDEKLSKTNETASASNGKRMRIYSNQANLTKYPMSSVLIFFLNPLQLLSNATCSIEGHRDRSSYPVGCGERARGANRVSFLFNSI